MGRYVNYAGLGAATDQQGFASAVASASAAMGALAAKASALRLASTNAAVAGLAEEALGFATGRGPRLIATATANNDSTRLMVVQKVTKNIMSALSGELTDALITRFLLLGIPVVGPLLAVAPAEINEIVRQGVLDATPPKIPNLDKGIPLSVKIGLAIGGLFVVGYFVRAFK